MSINRLRIPKHYHEESKFASTLLLFGILVLLSLNKPAFSDWYNRQGLKKYNQGQLAGAEADYLQALALDPDNVNAHYNLGSLYQDLQELDKAKSQYQFAVKGNFIKAHNNLARLWILENKPELATPLLSKSLAAINILERALSTTGHVGTWVVDPNACGECDSLARNLALKKLGGLAAWSGN